MKNVRLGFHACQSLGQEKKCIFNSTPVAMSILQCPIGAIHFTIGHLVHLPTEEYSSRILFIWKSAPAELADSTRLIAN